MGGLTGGYNDLLLSVVVNHKRVPPTWEHCYAKKVPQPLGKPSLHALVL